MTTLKETLNKFKKYRHTREGDCEGIHKSSPLSKEGLGEILKGQG